MFVVKFMKLGITHRFVKVWCLKTVIKTLSTTSKIVGIVSRKAYAVAQNPIGLGQTLSAEMAEEFTLG